MANFCLLTSEVNKNVLQKRRRASTHRKASLFIILHESLFRIEGADFKAGIDGTILTRPFSRT